ncbi:putative reverse transcriptase domain-containing protein [Tanacetum coccineum]
MKNIFQRLPFGRGLAGYYRRFITNSSKVAKPLASLTQKIQKYEWVKEQKEAFQTLKDNLCDTSILSLPDGSKEFVVYCDASNQGLGCAKRQVGYKSIERDRLMVIEVMVAMDISLCSHFSDNENDVTCGDLEAAFEYPVTHGHLSKERNSFNSLADKPQRCTPMYGNPPREALHPSRWAFDETREKEEVTQVKVLMALADDELIVGKNHARNGEWVDVTIRKVNTLLSMDEDVDWQTYCNTPIFTYSSGS